MANTVTSPNMNLVIPVPSTCPGPAWAQDLYACLYTTVDQHNHAAGSGVQIQPSGLNISSDLTFNNHNATALKTTTYQDQLSSLPTSVLGAVYMAGGDLWFNAGADGFPVPITSGHSVTGSPGTITGLPFMNAGAAYNSGTATFIFTSATSTAANIDGGSIKIREVAASTNAVTLSSPSGLVSNYTLTFAGALPSAPNSPSFVRVDNLGALTYTNTISAMTVTTLTIGSGGPTLTNSSSTLIASGSIKVGGSSGNTLGDGTVNAAHTLTTSAQIQPGGSGNACINGTGNTNTLDVIDTSAVSRPIVVSENPSHSGVLIVCGNVNSSQTVTTGQGTEGFTVAKTGGGAAHGDYTCTFSHAFYTAPVCAFETFAPAGVNYTHFVISNTTTTVRVAFFVATTGAAPATDIGFNMIAIGQRA